MSGTDELDEDLQDVADTDEAARPEPAFGESYRCNLIGYTAILVETC